MSQDVARSFTRPVPFGFGCSSLLYRFWSIQIDSFTEFDAGSSVSTRTAFAMTRVLLVPVPPPPVPPPLLPPPLEQPAATMASATRASPAVRGPARRWPRAREPNAPGSNSEERSDRGQLARSIGHPHFVDCRQRVFNLERCPNRVNSSSFAVTRTVTSTYMQVGTDVARS